MRLVASHVLSSCVLLSSVILIVCMSVCLSVCRSVIADHMGHYWRARRRYTHTQSLTETTDLIVTLTFFIDISFSFNFELVVLVFCSFVTFCCLSLFAFHTCVLLVSHIHTDVFTTCTHTYSIFCCHISITVCSLSLSSTVIHTFHVIHHMHTHIDAPSIVVVIAVCLSLLSLSSLSLLPLYIRFM